MLTKNELNNLYVKGANTVGQEYLCEKFGRENLRFFKNESQPPEEHGVYKCTYDFVVECYNNLTANNGLSFKFFILGEISKKISSAESRIRGHLKFEKTGTVVRRRIRAADVKITFTEVRTIKKSPKKKMKPIIKRSY